MKARPDHRTFEQIEILAELCSDVASQAGVVRDLGRHLTREERGQLETLIRVAGRTKDMLSKPVEAVA